MEKLDKFHINFSKIDGADKTFNFIISPREDGKTTMFVCRKTWPAFQRGAATIIQVRNKVEMSESLVDTYCQPIRKYIDDSFEVTYRLGDLSKGLCPVFEKKTGTMIYYFLSLSTRLDTIKKQKITTPGLWLVDEMIINPDFHEKYLPKEAFRFKEAFTTFFRENPKMRTYFLGNPYTLWNPYLDEFGIKASSLVKNKVVTGNNWACWRKGLSPELYKKVKAQNPLFDEDGAYRRYALDGDAINDSRLWISEKRPGGFSLYSVIIKAKEYVGIFRSSDPFSSPRFWVGKVDDVSARRAIYAFAFEDMEKGSRLYQRKDAFIFERLKSAMTLRNVAYESLDLAYFFEEIYDII